MKYQCESCLKAFKTIVDCGNHEVNCAIKSADGFSLSEFLELMGHNKIQRSNKKGSHGIWTDYELNENYALLKNHLICNPKNLQYYRVKDPYFNLRKLLQSSTIFNIDCCDANALSRVLNSEGICYFERFNDNDVLTVATKSYIQTRVCETFKWGHVEIAKSCYATWVMSAGRWYSE